MKRGVYVVNAAEAPADSTAELTVGLMIVLARRILTLNNSMRQGVWCKDKGLGIELRGKTLGIVGLGRIGSRVAKVVKAMGMRVLAYDPYVSKDQADEIGADLVDLETLLRSSDFVSLHVPLTEETQRLVGEKELKLVKPEAFLINTARGGIVAEGALYQALISGRLAGAPLDVFETEPSNPHNPLFKLDNVVVTPHIGGSTRDAQRRITAVIMEDILRVLRGETPRNRVELAVKVAMSQH